MPATSQVVTPQGYAGIPDGDAASGAYGRASEVRRLDLLVARALAGSSVAAAITGAAGVGKTHHARIAAARASRRGFRIASVAGYAQRVPAPLALYDLIAALGPSNAGGEGANLVRSARSAVEAAARQDPLLVVFDGVDLFSAEEAALVEGLLRRPPSGRVLVLLTLRTDGAVSGARRELERLATPPACERIDLSGLTPAATEALLSAWFAPRVLGPEFVDSVQEITGGNAHYLSEVHDRLAQLPQAEREAALRGAADVTEELLPERTRRQALATLEGLDKCASACLRALACWGREASVEVLATLLRCPQRAVLRSLQSLEERGIVLVGHGLAGPRFRMADPVVAHCAERSAPLRMRRAFHDRAARLIEADGGGVVAASLLARHYVEGEPGLTRARAARASDAARALTGAGRYHSARRLLEYVVAGLDPRTDADQHGQVLAALGKVYAKLGDRSRIGDLMDRAADPGLDRSSPEARSEVTRWLGRRLADAGRDQEAFELSRRLLARRDSLSAADRADVERDGASIALHAGKADLALSLAASAADSAQRAQRRDLESLACVLTGSIHLATANPQSALAVAVRAFAVARQARFARGISRSTAGIGIAHTDLGALARGARWLRRAYRLARDSGDRPAQSISASYLVRAYVDLGAWDEASSMARIAVALDDGLYRNRRSRMTRAAAATLLARRGDPGARAALSPQAGEDLAHTPIDVALPEMVALAAIAEGQGSDTLAMEILDRLDGLVAERRDRRRDLLADVLPFKARVAARVGATDALAAIRTRLCAAEDEVSLPVLTAEIRHVAALAHMLDGDAQAASRAALDAASAFDGMGFAWRAAAARLTAGAALAACGEAEDAARALRHAYGAFREMGAARDVARANEALEAIHRRPPRPRATPGTLTERERQVAEGASGGLTNREIAERLSISERTVTTHVHNILSKLALRSRVQLEGWLHDHPR